MALVRWPEIELFHQVRLTMTEHPSLAGATTLVTYRGKVKLHGTNAAVQKLPGGAIEAQSRTAVLTPTSDNAGFARWVQGQQEAWQRALPEGTVVFGEWCGPGIQAGVAINQIAKKIFAVFAASKPERDDLLVEPHELAALVHGLDGVHVLPWFGEPLAVDWALQAEGLAPVTAQINAWVEQIERSDPWVREAFGVEGVGEGLVFYPTSHPGREAFTNLAFKAKGEQHRVMRSKVAAQVDPEVARGVEQFVDLVLTEARLDQGAQAVRPEGERDFDARRIGAFLAWITRDVTKEAQAELRASGLDWKQVQRPLSDRARAWYLAKLSGA